ncbi:MAG TPA: hypothetical protein VFU56_07515 [Gaiellaceae bacterium]|nr:hypothetical protein [Gaiellaceae bacterium]
MHTKLAATALVCAVALTSTATALAGQPAWERALVARSDALNRHYHLGGYAVPRTLTARTTPAWLNALEVRSRALDERYGLGRTAAAGPAAGGFDWGDAAIGAAVAAAACALLVCAAALLRGRIALRRLMRVS